MSILKVEKVEIYPFHLACNGDGGRCYKQGFRVTLEDGFVVYLCEKCYNERIKIKGSQIIARIG